MAAGRRDASCERLLELDTRLAGVAADEDPAAFRPERGGAAEALDELRRDELAHDAADAVRAEIASDRGHVLKRCWAAHAVKSAKLRASLDIQHSSLSALA
jgi:hypothetical protein